MKKAAVFNFSYRESYYSKDRITTKSFDMEGNKEAIEITNNSRLIDIQEGFSLVFPYLMIEFFYLKKDGRTYNNRIDKHTLVQKIIPVNTIHKVDIRGTTTVWELVNELHGILKVGVDICRKSGSVWNRISVTVGWTLEEQNSAGAFICSEMLKNGSNSI